MSASLVMGEVLSRKKQGEDYYSLTVVAPAVAESVAPGQFVNVRPVGRTAHILRRPFSVYRVHKQGGWASTFEIIFDIRGPGTEELAALDVHDKLDVMGPLGNGFRLPKKHSRCLLVGGGIGAAPLFFLAARLREAGHRIDVVLGARTSELLLNAMDARRLASICRITTEDGSAGDTGVVTDVLGPTIERCGSEVVYTCGPHAMLEAVAGVCGAAKLPVQVAVEELMACGFGVCMSCVIPLRVRRKKGRSGSGGVLYARSCTEGPVFDGSQVIWSDHIAAPDTIDLASELVPPPAAPPRAQHVPAGAGAEHSPPGN